MPTQTPSTPWHKESYERLLTETLPQLLATRLPLAGYHVEDASPGACRVRVVLANGNGDLEVEYTGIPRPDEQGVFQIDGEPRVVLPFALQDDLATAEVLCVGERLYQHIDANLGDAPENLPWDAALLRAWLPLDQWIAAFFERHAQKLDQINWLAAQRHLRAIFLPNRQRLITPGHVGRACPFETPEGPNIARVLRLAVGAAIRDGAIVIANDRPEAGLGMTASMIPLLEHNDPNRLLMGANMMGQWIVPPDPEPALVQTGNEPNAPDFWCGRNLLTAFVSWGADTFEDGIVLSESAAARLNYPHPLEPGDKISNRHGTKGVVTRILPDDEMPHLPDGTPVELVYSFMGVPGRMNFGQVREALWGRIARSEGVPVIAPPFRAPGEDELRQRMARAGLPENGMETLALGASGEPLARPSLAGWVYWGKTVHLARRKIRGGTDAPAHLARQRGLQRQTELEYRALSDAGAFETVLETFNTRAAGRENVRNAAGTLQQAPPPTPRFAALQRRLSAAGIRVMLEDDYLTFVFAPPEGETLPLARPVPHPWLWERELTEVGVFDDLPEYAPLAEANARLARMLDSHAPTSLIESAHAQLDARVRDFFDALLTPADVRFDARVRFSGRTVIAPGPDLRLDQVGLAEDLAWTFFGPLVTRELGDETTVQNRAPEAAQALDEIMARSWVLVHRAPALTPTAILAFHPVRIPGRVVRIHPLVCPWLNADFDGDQVAVFLPLTPAGQREAGERLSVAGHLARDPELIRSLLPAKDVIWGLASLSLTPEGRTEIEQLAGAKIAMPDGYLTQTALANVMQTLLAEKGTGHAMESLDRLARHGFEAVKKSGASVSPFIGDSLQRPPAPEGDDPERWETYIAQLAEQIASRTDFDDPDLGVHLLSIKSQKRNPTLRALACLSGARGVVTGVHGRAVVIRHSYRNGLTPEEMNTCVVGAREGLAAVVQQWEQSSERALESGESQSFNVLARARRAPRPGIVFARAAAIHERDPLVDVDSRLFVGVRFGAAVPKAHSAV